MPQSKPKSVVILGGGLAGLATAWELLHDDYEVTVLEKTPHLGGMCRTIRRGGHYLDLGPHNIHTKHRQVITLLNRQMRDDLVRHSPTFKLLLRGCYVDYPLRGMKALMALPKHKIPLALWDFFFARLRMFLRTPADEKSFKEWITNRFGGTLYNTFFGPYAEKTWKIGADKISKYVAEKRVPVVYLSDYIAQLFRRSSKSRAEENPFLFDHYHLKKGVGMLVDHLASMVREAGGEIVTGAGLKRIRIEDKAARSVAYDAGGCVAEKKADFVVSTIPVTEMIPLLDCDIPRPAREAAEGLEYCSQAILFIMARRGTVLNSSVLYFSDPEVRMTRAFEASQFSREMSPPGGTALSVEFTCRRGDADWKSGADSFFQSAMDVFERYGVLSRGEVEDYFVEKLAHAYPLFTVGFQEKLGEVLSLLDTFDNILTMGRQGLFCYANIDETLMMSMRVADSLRRLSYRGVDHRLLFGDFLPL